MTHTKAPQCVLKTGLFPSHRMAACLGGFHKPETRDPAVCARIFHFKADQAFKRGDGAPDLVMLLRKTAEHATFYRAAPIQDQEISVTTWRQGIIADHPETVLHIAIEVIPHRNRIGRPRS